jgi:hypothetical protein
MNHVPESDIKNAIIWDRPALYQGGTREAKVFIDTLDLFRVDPELSGSDPLSVLSRAIACEIHDRDDEALDLYRQLAADEDPVIGLLGTCALLWTNIYVEPRPFDETIGLLDQFEDGNFKARVVTKMIAAAFDHREDERLPELFEVARNFADENSRLRFRIEIEMQNFTGIRTEFAEGNAEDPLSEYPWIQRLVAGSAEKAVVSRVVEAAKSSWTMTMEFGKNPVRDLVAADLQVRWAGAIWLRRTISQQLAATLLTGAADTPEEYGRALGLWGVGRGTDASRVANFAEPYFSEQSADIALSYVARAGVVASQYDHVLLDLALDLWDVISPEAARQLLDRFTPWNSEHSLAQRVSSLWSLLSLRVPELWEKRFLALSDDEASGLLATTTPVVAKRMPRVAAQRLLDLAGVGETLSADAAPLILTLEQRLKPKEALEFTESLPPYALIRVAELPESRISEEELSQAISELTEEVESSAAEAIGGKASFGGANPVQGLAKAVNILGGAPQSTLQVLEHVATNAQVPMHLRYDALRALTHLAVDGNLPEETGILILERAPVAGAQSLFGSYPSALLESQKVSLAMALGFREGALASTLVLARDKDARVRINAMEAVNLGRSESPDDFLEAILVSGLFDPDSDVVRAAIMGFAHRPPMAEATREAVFVRLGELLTIGDRNVRSSVALFSVSEEIPHELREHYEDLRTRASNDRSFTVRMEANNEAA